MEIHTGAAAGIIDGPGWVDLHDLLTLLSDGGAADLAGEPFPSSSEEPPEPPNPVVSIQPASEMPAKGAIRTDLLWMNGPPNLSSAGKRSELLAEHSSR